eukprot:s4967_g8.t1
MPASASSPDSPDDDSSSGRFSGSSDHGSSPVNDPNPEHDDPCTGADRSVHMDADDDVDAEQMETDEESESAGEHNGNEDETPVVLATSVHADATDVAADDDNGAEEIETDEEKESISDQPPAPDTLKGLFHWPSCYATKLLHNHEQSASNFKNLVHGGRQIHLIESFSGTGNAGFALKTQYNALVTASGRMTMISIECSACLGRCV